jgi:hypothetical protein
MTVTIKSSKLNRDVVFSKTKSNHIYVNLNYQEGPFGNSVCENGKTVGKCIKYKGDSVIEFSKICKSWWRDYLSNLR